MSWLASKYVRIALLPLVLSLGTVLGLGSYFETSDDQHLVWLFQGLTTGAPVPAVPLYFHGLGHGLAALYAAWPGVPWYGLGLAGLLLMATVLSFAVLDKLLRPHLRPAALAAVLTLFFLAAWTEHWLWFSHLRVAALLAGSALLFAAQRLGQQKALLASLVLMLLGWAIRPGAAGLVLLAAAPAAGLLVDSWRRAAPLLLSVVAVLGLAAAVVAATESPAAANLRAMDGTLGPVLDYGLLRLRPHTPADSLTAAAVPVWLFGDSAIVSPAALRRVAVFDAGYFLRHELPAKLATRLPLLGRDYFLMLLLLAVMAGWALRYQPYRPRTMLLQLGWLGLLLLLAGGLKLPPRLALPLLDFWLLTNVILLVKSAFEKADSAADFLIDSALPSKQSATGKWLLAAAVGAGLLVYGFKTAHRRQVLGLERRRHAMALAEICRTAPHIRIIAGADDLLKSLSPFQNYSLGAGPVVWLTGWPSYLPAQRKLYEKLAGTTTQNTCLLRLAQQPQTEWLLTPETAAWLNRRFAFDSLNLTLEPRHALPADTALRFYRPRRLLMP